MTDKKIANFFVRVIKEGKIRTISQMFGKMPEFFSSREDLRQQWANPDTRELLLNKMENAGYDLGTLKDIRKLIDAENSDILDVLEYICFNTTPLEREQRAANTRTYAEKLARKQQDFVECVINAYVHTGFEELRTANLSALLKLKFGSVPEGISALGGIEKARNTFYEFQQNLYA